MSRLLAIIFVLIILGISSCQLRTEIPSIITIAPSVTGRPIPTRPLVFASDTPQPTNTLTPSPTSIPTATPTSYPLWVFSSRGTTLWVKLHNRGYWVMDYPSRAWMIIPGPPYDCPEPLINSRQVICNADDHQVLLYDLFSHQTDFLGIRAHFWSYRDGIIYYLPEGNGKTNTIYAFDLRLRISAPVFTDIDTAGWDSPPHPSIGAKYFVVHKGDWRLYRLLMTGETELLSPPGLVILYSFTLSPVDQKIAYAGTYIKTEVIGDVPPTDGFITDLDSRQTTHLTTSIKIEKYLTSDGWPEWSPDGKQIVAFYDNWLCIVNITTSHEECILARDDRESSGISTSAWSPDGKWIAYIIDIGSWLNVLTVETMEKVGIKVNGGYIRDIFWR